jgi:hypothetical protein
MAEVSVRWGNLAEVLAKVSKSLANSGLTVSELTKNIAGWRLVIMIELTGPTSGAGTQGRPNQLITTSPAGRI